MKLTDAQLDRLTEIMHNLPAEEIDQAIAGLNAEERAELRTQSVDLANRLMEIACKAEPIEAEGSTK